MSISKQKDLENILAGVVDVLSYTGPKSAAKSGVSDFLHCAYELFKSWEGKFSPILTGVYDQDTFWALFEDFLRECCNGSWSQMSRHKNEIADYKESVFSSVQRLLSAGTSLGPVVEIVKEVTDKSSSSKIKGLSPFILSGILFASNEDNFMILDKPVLEYFGLKDFKQALTEYKNIIDISREYSKQYNLSMWYINKAYGILSNGGVLKVRKLCGNCTFMNSPYEFL